MRPVPRLLETYEEARLLLEAKGWGGEGGGAPRRDAGLARFHISQAKLSKKTTPGSKFTIEPEVAEAVQGMETRAGYERQTEIITRGCWPSTVIRPSWAPVGGPPRWSWSRLPWSSYRPSGPGTSCYTSEALQLSQSFTVKSIAESEFQKIVDAQQRGEGVLRPTLEGLKETARLDLDRDAFPLHELLTNGGERSDGLAFIMGMGIPLLDEGTDGWRCIENPEVVAVARLLNQLQPSVVGRRARSAGRSAPAGSAHAGAVMGCPASAGAPIHRARVRRRWAPSPARRACGSID